MKRLIWFLSAVFMGVYVCRPIADPDLWWHLVVGKWILAHHQIPSVDLWTMFAAEKPWRAYSWSNELVYAFFENHFGLGGVIFLHFVLGSLLALSFFYCFGSLARNWFLGALLGIVTTAGCIEHFSLRPQTVTWICLCWALYLAESVREKGFAARYAIGLAAIFSIWANSHISTFVGIVALALWVWDSKHPSRALLAVSFAFLGTLATPYFGGEWLTFFSKADHPLTFATISEFQPATITHYSTGLVVLLLCLAVVLGQFAPAGVTLHRVLAASLFVFGGLAVVKFIPMASIMLSALVGSLWAESHEAGKKLGHFDEALTRLQRLTDRLIGSGLAFFIMCLIAVKAHGVLQEPVNKKAVPVDAVEFIKAHHLRHPILNAFSEGGYVMYAFSNADGSLSHPVSIDGRTNLISNELWRSYSAALEGSEKWRAYVDLVKPNTVLWPSERPLTSLLTADGSWCRVFNPRDQNYSVLVPKKEVEAISDSDGLHCL